MASGEMTASEVAELLDLKPHPEGGYYAETFRDGSVSLTTSQLPPRYKVDRAVSTAIYFLLPTGSVSRLHRIPCAETWHFYKGEPLTVFELHDDGHIDLTVIGPHLEAGQRPQYTVPPNVWFGSFPTLDLESFASDGSFLVKSRKRDPEEHYSLVGCTCAPGFQYEDFEMATFEDELTQFISRSSHKRPDRLTKLNLVIKVRHQVYHFVSTLQQYLHCHLSDISWRCFQHSLKDQIYLYFKWKGNNSSHNWYLYMITADLACREGHRALGET